MVLRALILLTSLFPTILLASTPMSSHGEFTTPDFYGSHLADTVYSPYHFELRLVENQLRNNYVESKINDEFITLSDFIANEFYLGTSCPDAAFSEKFDYLRFLNRLQVMSYLFQSLQKHEFSMKELDYRNTCMVDWSKEIKKCRPQTKEMKGFLTNAKVAFKNLDEINTSFKKGVDTLRSKWIKNLDHKKNVTLSQNQLILYCSYQFCPQITPENLSESMSKVCQQELELFTDICSERDSLYGLSYVPETYPLIVSSSGIRGVDVDGYGAGCVKRFIAQNKNLEKNIPFLKNTFSTLYEYNLEESPQNPQGKLFTIGALKEFSDKGLKTIFQQKTTPKMPKEVVQTEKKKSTPELTKIELPKFEKKKKNIKPQKVYVKKMPQIPAIRKSSFLISSEVREQFSLSLISVDMEKFRLDHVFTLSEKEKLLPVIEQFSTVKALKSMAKLDALGSHKAPLPLKFVKFLIDEKMNQNLFNINLVLGNKFHVINDIDKKITEPNLIELSFNSSSLLWELKILDPNTN